MSSEKIRIWVINKDFTEHDMINLIIELRSDGWHGQKKNSKWDLQLAFQLNERSLAHSWPWLRKFKHIIELGYKLNMAMR